MSMANEMDRAAIRRYNRRAWDKAVEWGSEWTVPVGAEVIAAARRGEWQIILTPTKTVPAAWFLPLAGCRVLCLASGGVNKGRCWLLPARR